MKEQKREGVEVPAETQDSREEWVAPAVTDLGSFEELTAFNPGGLSDTEGSS